MPTTVQPINRYRPVVRRRSILTSRRQHGVLCGCGRTTRLRRHQRVAPVLSLAAIPILVATIAAGLPSSVIVVALVVTAATIAHQVRVSFLVAELAGTGFCPVCTRRP